MLTSKMYLCFFVVAAGVYGEGFVRGGGFEFTGFVGVDRGLWFLGVAWSRSLGVYLLGRLGLEKDGRRMGGCEPACTFLAQNARYGVVVSCRLIRIE